MKAFFILIVTGLALCAAAAPPATKITVRLDAPASNYKLAITGVYDLGKEIWVLSQVSTQGDFGATVITTLSDSAQIAHTDKPVKHKVLGKTWNWGENTQSLEYVGKAEAAALKKRLATAKKIRFKSKGN